MNEVDTKLKDAFTSPKVGASHDILFWCKINFVCISHTKVSYLKKLDTLIEQ